MLTALPTAESFNDSIDVSFAEGYSHPQIGKFCEQLPECPARLMPGDQFRERRVRVPWDKPLCPVLNYTRLLTPL